MVALLAVVAGLFLLQAPMTGDWAVTFHPAAQHPLAPYTNSYHFVYPPWLALIMWPFGWLDPVVSRALFGVATVLMIGLALQRLGGDFVGLLLVLLNPITLTVLVRGETDGLPLLGLVFGLAAAGPTQLLGLTLLALKPQTLGLAIPVIFLRSAHKRLLAAGFTTILLLSLLVYGFWPLAIWERLPDLFRAGDVSLWPYGIPVGLFLFYLAVRRQQVELGALASFFLAPYLSWYSLMGYLVILASRWPRYVLLLLTLATWLIVYWLARS